MARGGKREGAGRKAQGVTKKVSLTLTQAEWDYLESLDMKLVTFIKNTISQQKSEQKDNISEKSYRVLYEATSHNASQIAKRFGVFQARVEMAVEEFQKLNSKPLPVRPVNKRVEELERRLEQASQYFDMSYFIHKQEG